MDQEKDKGIESNRSDTEIAVQPYRLLYSSGEMAAMCGVHITTWCEWVRRGQVPQPIEVNGARKWPAKLVDKWMDQKIKESLQITRSL